MNIKCQCSICGHAKQRDQVSLVPFSDGRTYLYECNEACNVSGGICEWLIKFPGSYKKLDKFLEENPEP